MKFDALVFESWMTGLKVEDALAEIASHIGKNALRDSSVPPTDYGYADQRSVGVVSMRRLIASCLAERVCHAMHWFGETLVIAEAGAFTTFLDDLARRHSRSLISRYFDASTDALPFCLARFGDYGGESEVCWKIAQGSSSGLLVVCNFSDGTDWWRPYTALATPLRVRTKAHFGEHCTADVIYRVDSELVLSQLWSHTSRNDGIAYMCAPEGANMDSMLAAFDNGSDSRLIEFAGDEGWVYMQRYGGGADEHYARFASNDPQLLESVYGHAEERAARDSGWWLSGMV